VIEERKIVVGRTTTTKHARKWWAKKPASKSSFIQHQNDDYSNDLWKFEKGKRGSEKLFPLFPFSNLFYLFLIFLFHQMQRWAKTNMQWKRRKENGGFGVWEKIKMQMVEEGWKRKWDNYQFITQRELHVYSPRARLSPYLWRLIHRCDGRSCHNWRDFFLGVSPNEFPYWLPLDVL
jgi:hypothetical protein